MTAAAPVWHRSMRCFLAWFRIFIKTWHLEELCFLRYYLSSSIVFAAAAPCVVPFRAERWRLG